MKRTLAQTESYDAVAEFEQVSLIFRRNLLRSGQRQVIVGDFYRDAEAAAFSPDERFLVMVGCGFILYRLREPFEPFQYNIASPQWLEIKREPGQEWWIESVRWLDARRLAFTVDEHSEAAGEYQATVRESEAIHIEIEQT